MNRNSSPRQHLAESDGSTRGIATTTQWHDVELAMKIARHNYEKWLHAGQEDPASPATMQADHTHAALHEAARVIAMLIETFRVEVSALISGAGGVPSSPRSSDDHLIVENAPTSMSSALAELPR